MKILMVSLIAGLLLFAGSCSKQKDDYVGLDAFPMETLEVRKPAWADTTAIYDVFDMYCFDSLLVTLSGPKTNKYFGHIIHLNEPGTLGHFAPRGRGPGEVGIVFSASRNEDQLFLFDQTSGSMLVFNMRKYIRHKPLDFHRLFHFKNPLHVGKVINYPKDYFLTDGMSKQGRWIVYDKEGKKRKTFGNFPPQDSAMNYMSRAMGYSGRFAVSPDGAHAAYGTHNGAVLSFFRKDNQKIVRIREERIYHLPEFEASAKDGRFSAPIKKSAKVGFIDFAASNNYLYTLYSGEKVKSNRFNAFYSNKILVMNWQGEAVVGYKIQPMLRTLAVSKMDEQLFGWTVKGIFVEAKMTHQ